MGELMTGYIKLFRQMAEWEWYKDSNTKAVFLHLLLMANHTAKRWRGIEIKRGQHITSIERLADETGLTEQNVRTAINHLKSTHELTSKSTNKWTLLTVVNYEIYQGDSSDANKQTNKQPNKQLTNDQQTTNKQLTTNNNDKNEKRMINNDKKGEASEQRRRTRLYRNGVKPLTKEENDAIIKALKEGARR